MDVHRNLVGILFRKEVTRGDTKNVGSKFEKKKRKKKRKEGKGLGCTLKGVGKNSKGKTGLLFIPGNCKLTRETYEKSRDVPLFRLPSLRRSNEWLKCTLRHVEFNDVKKSKLALLRFSKDQGRNGEHHRVFWSRESRRVICTRLFSVSATLKNTHLIFLNVIL